MLIDDLSIVESMAAEVEEQAVRFRKESIEEEVLSADFPLPYIPWSELLDGLHGRTSLELGHSTEEISDTSLASQFGHDERFGGRLKPFVEYAGSIVERGGQIVVVSRQSPRLHEMWLEQSNQGPQTEDELVSSPSSSVEFIESSLSEGFVLGGLHLITDSKSLVGSDRNHGHERDLRLKRPNLFMPICRRAIMLCISTMASGILAGWCNVNSITMCVSFWRWNMTAAGSCLCLCTKRIG